MVLSQHDVSVAQCWGHVLCVLKPSGRAWGGLVGTQSAGIDLDRAQPHPCCLRGAVPGASCPQHHICFASARVMWYIWQHRRGWYKPAEHGSRGMRSVVAVRGRWHRAEPSTVHRWCCAWGPEWWKPHPAATACLGCGWEPCRHGFLVECLQETGAKCSSGKDLREPWVQHRTLKGAVTWKKPRPDQMSNQMGQRSPSPWKSLMYHQKGSWVLRRNLEMRVNWQATTLFALDREAWARRLHCNCRSSGTNSRSSCRAWTVIMQFYPGSLGKVTTTKPLTSCRAWGQAWIYHCILKTVIIFLMVLEDRELQAWCWHFPPIDTFNGKLLPYRGNSWCFTLPERFILRRGFHFS